MADPNRDQDLNVGGEQVEDNPKSDTSEQVDDSEQSGGNQQGGAQQGGSQEGSAEREPGGQR